MSIEKDLNDDKSILNTQKDRDLTLVKKITDLSKIRTQIQGELNKYSLSSEEGWKSYSRLQNVNFKLTLNIIRLSKVIGFEGDIPREHLIITSLYFNIPLSYLKDLFLVNFQLERKERKVNTNYFRKVSLNYVMTSNNDAFYVVVYGQKSYYYTSYNRVINFCFKNNFEINKIEFRRDL